MIIEPFSIFRPFADHFTVRFFTKEDSIATDDDAMHALETDRIASLKQIHGHRIVRIDAPTHRTEEADGLVTNANNLWLTIRAADCQQLIVYAPSKNVAGVVHAGWKGLKAGVIPSFFDMLKNEWNIDPSDTFVAIGPSLCTDCAEFTDPVTELAGLDPAFFHGRNADLRGIADWQLDELGVPTAHRERHPDCTKCKNDVYWSYRGGDREVVKSGYTNVMVCVLN